MDERKHLILLKGQNKTKEIRFIKRNEQGRGYDISFDNGKTYTYGYTSVIWFQEPVVKNPQLYRIRANGRPLDKIDGIFVFGQSEEYWHIVCGNGYARTWRREELEIETSCLEQETVKDRFAYLTDLARVSELKGDDGDALLYHQYKKADFIAEGTALPGYLYPEVNQRKTYPAQSLIFPFGGNASQFQAVENALNHQLSVIQGPPGTGKTQTILNIIANLLIRGQTVQVVSNNNSATQNVLEKLSSPEYGLDFLVAALGKRENKAAFIKNQTGRYPNIAEWSLGREYMAELQQKIDAYSAELRTHFGKQNRLAEARQELSALEVEKGHFEQFCADQKVVKPRKQPRKEIASKKVLSLLQECEGFCERSEKVSVWHKFKTSLFYGVFEMKFYKNDIGDVITYLQSLFYLLKHKELSHEIEELEQYLKNVEAKGKMDELTRCSMTYLRGMIYKYQGREKDAIILTTVDDELTDFSDDPYMLNVAVSRAKKKLRLVISGTAQNEDSNIRDLVAYMEYQNGQVVDSEIYSVFDLMYQEYTKERLEFLQKHQMISQYDSENLMYAALTDLLDSMPELGLKVACHQSLRLLFRDSFRMTEEERLYASRPGTHVDFLLYNPVSKAPVLAIEVDGFHFHKDGTKQARRDRLKDSIFEKYGIPLLRLPTNGSGEIEKVRRYLEKEEQHAPEN